MVTGGLAAEIAFGLHQSLRFDGCPRLRDKLGLSCFVEIPRTSTTQKLGRFSIPLGHLYFIVGIGTTTISLGVIFPPRKVGKLQKSH